MTGPQPKMTTAQAIEAHQLMLHTPDKVLERRYGCAKVTIKQAIRRAGLEVPKRSRHWQQAAFTPAQVAEIQALLARGVSVSKVADKYRVNRSTIYNTLGRTESESRAIC